MQHTYDWLLVAKSWKKQKTRVSDGWNKDTSIYQWCMECWNIETQLRTWHSTWVDFNFLITWFVTLLCSCTRCLASHNESNNWKVSRSVTTITSHWYQRNQFILFQLIKYNANFFLYTKNNTAQSLHFWHFLLQFFDHHIPVNIREKSV